jgi:hypothetical protein
MGGGVLFGEGASQQQEPSLLQILQHRHEGEVGHFAGPWQQKKAQGQDAFCELEVPFAV